MVAAIDRSRTARYVKCHRVITKYCMDGSSFKRFGEIREARFQFGYAHCVLDDILLEECNSREAFRPLAKSLDTEDNSIPPACKHLDAVFYATRAPWMRTLALLTCKRRSLWNTRYSASTTRHLPYGSTEPEQVRCTFAHSMWTGATCTTTSHWFSETKTHEALVCWLQGNTSSELPRANLHLYSTLTSRQEHLQTGSHHQFCSLPNPTCVGSALACKYYNIKMYKSVYIYTVR